MTWDRFEELIRDLLRLQGWQVVPEKLLGHKKVDAVASRPGFLGRTVRMAVECKDHSRRLSQKQVTDIYVNYLPLIQANVVDGVILATSKGISASAESYVESAAGFLHGTYEDLLWSSIDFSSYLTALIDEYSSEGPGELYIAQVAIDASGEKVEDLAATLDSWATSKADAPPMAVLGGYGIGKSTLARRLAFKLAQRHIECRASRIPILIPLEGLVNETSLEGLLGSHFTSRYITNGYNFDLFVRMNRRGRFVILLDGFDEMKRTMSWEAMRFNFQQINRLVVKNARVVLLGRPSAFLSEEEQLELLHGKRFVLGEERKIPGWPDYEEWSLELFSPEKVRAYVDRYSSSFEVVTGKDKDVTEKLGDKRLADLASRPVQLKMLLAILPTYEGPLDALSTTILYSEFVDLVIRREMIKLSRSAFSTQERREFAGKLAFWMWRRDRGTEVRADDIPNRLFDGLVPKGAFSQTIKRDLLAGCFLEKKPPAGLYFPHRSFSEFLVAEELLRQIADQQHECLSLNFVTPEITDFTIELIAKKAAGEWRSWLKDSVCRGLSPQIAELFVRVCDHHGLGIPVDLKRELTHRLGKKPAKSLGLIAERTPTGPSATKIKSKGTGIRNVQAPGNRETLAKRDKTRKRDFRRK